MLRDLEGQSLRWTLRELFGFWTAEIATQDPDWRRVWMLFRAERARHIDDALPELTEMLAFMKASLAEFSRATVFRITVSLKVLSDDTVIAELTFPDAAKDDPHTVAGLLINLCCVLEKTIGATHVQGLPIEFVLRGSELTLDAPVIDLATP